MFCSIIIPYKNASKTIIRCFKSLIMQSLDSSYYEVIFINDFSDNETTNLIKKLIKNKNNFRIINSKIRTTGPGHARNLGIKVSKGKYLYFLDSDDFLKKNALNFLYKKSLIRNPDIICNNFEIIKNLKNLKHHKRHDLNILKNQKKFIKNYFNLSIIGQVISNLFKKDILSKNKIFFKSGYYEDVLFFFKAFYFSKKKFITKKVLYTKVNTKNSIVNSISTNHIKDGLKVYYQIYKFLIGSKKNKKKEELKYFCITAFVGQFAVLLKRIKSFNNLRDKKESLESDARQTFFYYRKKINIKYVYKSKKDIFVANFLSSFLNKKI